MHQPGQKRVESAGVGYVRTFLEGALGDEGQVGEPALQAIKDVGGIHNSGAPHLTLLPVICTPPGGSHDSRHGPDHGCHWKETSALECRQAAQLCQVRVGGDAVMRMPQCTIQRHVGVQVQ